MKLYDKIFNVVKEFTDKFTNNPVTNVGVSGSIAAELTLIISLILACLLFRHVNVLLSAILILVIGMVLLLNMPLIPKFKSEQDDSLNKMLFYDDIIDNDVKNFIKELSTVENMQVPSVGEDLINSDGIIIGEAELFWEEYSIALILDELALEINDIKIFNLQNLNELKNELIERIQ